MIPIYSTDLVKMLDQLYPPRPPNPAQTEREIWMRAGERRLVERLIETIKQEETENVHERTQN
jgi:hypothetical protein